MALLQKFRDKWGQRIRWGTGGFGTAALIWGIIVLVWWLVEIQKWKDQVPCTDKVSCKHDFAKELNGKCVHKHWDVIDGVQKFALEFSDTGLALSYTADQDSVTVLKWKDYSQCDVQFDFYMHKDSKFLYDAYNRTVCWHKDDENSTAPRIVLGGSNKLEFTFNSNTDGYTRVHSVTHVSGSKAVPKYLSAELKTGASNTDRRAVIDPNAEASRIRKVECRENCCTSLSTP